MSEEDYIFTTPVEKYKDTYIEGIKDFQKEGIRYLNEDVNDLQNNFNNYLDKWNRDSEGVNLAHDRVPQTVYWLIVNNVYVGRVSIRHTLNDHLLKVGGHIGYDIIPSERKKGYGTALLKFALIKAKEFGIDKALLTCDEDNIGSRKIIEGAGGILENIIEGENNEPNKCRFWIQI